MAVKNKVQLITYPDSLGGDLKTLNNVLTKYFPKTFKGGIHILPPFPSSGDRGFAPLTYLEIEPQFGTWEDIRKLAENYDILLDLMVNHISKNSVFFRADTMKQGCFWIREMFTDFGWKASAMSLTLQQLRFAGHLLWQVRETQ